MSPNEPRYLWNQGSSHCEDFLQENADDHEDESDTSTLVGGEDIDEKTKAVVKK